MNVSFRSEKRLQQVNERDQKILRTLSDTMEVTHEIQEWDSSMHGSRKSKRS
jgi:hypothetical protein